MHDCLIREGGLRQVGGLLRWLRRAVTAEAADHLLGTFLDDNHPWLRAIAKSGN
jgi:hypothetical protein